MKNITPRERFYGGSIAILVCMVALYIVSGIYGEEGLVGALFSHLHTVSLVGAIIIFVIITGTFAVQNKFYKGFRYGRIYATVMSKLEQQLLDAGYYQHDKAGRIRLPKITLTLSQDLTSGCIRIENCIKLDRSLEDLDLSAGIGKYVVERSYGAADRNQVVYEIYDFRTANSQIFNSFREYAEYCKSDEPYRLKIDARTELALQGMMIVGQTGTGKTYSLYGLILQMLLKPVTYNLYFADPKGSSLYALGQILGIKTNAVSVDDIIVALRAFHQKMMERRHKLQRYLADQIDADYRTFQMEPFVFVFDEFASFMGVVKTLDKGTRDQINVYLRDIVLLGRQLGFFLVVCMQKSDAELIPTALRDNLPIKIVLGMAEPTTYQTTYGAGFDPPKRIFDIGEGLIHAPGFGSKPKICAFPTLRFDIAQAAKKLRKE